MLSACQFASAIVVLRQELKALTESNDALAKRIERLRGSIEDDSKVGADLAGYDKRQQKRLRRL